MESHHAMARCNKDRWSTAYFAHKSSLRVNSMTLSQWRGMGFWNEALLFSGHRHVEPGSRGQEAVEENAKMRAMKARSEWAGQGADSGTDKALEELFYGN